MIAVHRWVVFAAGLLVFVDAVDSLAHGGPLLSIVGIIFGGWLIVRALSAPATVGEE